MATYPRRRHWYRPLGPAAQGVDGGGPAAAVRRKSRARRLLELGDALDKRPSQSPPWERDAPGVLSWQEGYDDARLENLQMPWQSRTSRWQHRSDGLQQLTDPLQATGQKHPTKQPEPEPEPEVVGEAGPGAATTQGHMLRESTSGLLRALVQHARSHPDSPVPPHGHRVYRLEGEGSGRTIEAELDVARFWQLITSPSASREQVQVRIQALESCSQLKTAYAQANAAAEHAGDEGERVEGSASDDEDSSATVQPGTDISRNIGFYQKRVQEQEQYLRDVKQSSTRSYQAFRRTRASHVPDKELPLPRFSLWKMEEAKHRAERAEHEAADVGVAGLRLPAIAGLELGELRVRPQSVSRGAPAQQHGPQHCLFSCDRLCDDECVRCVRTPTATRGNARCPTGYRRVPSGDGPLHRRQCCRAGEHPGCQVQVRGSPGVLQAGNPEQG
jgi:hypothetical protein